MKVRRKWSRVLASLAATAVLVAGQASAWALCPNCLGQKAALTTTLRIVGVFLLVPPAIFFAVAKIIRRLDRDGG
jgi:hypothetical protein